MMLGCTSSRPGTHIMLQAHAPSNNRLFHHTEVHIEMNFTGCQVPEYYPHQPQWGWHSTLFQRLSRMQLICFLPLSTLHPKQGADQVLKPEWLTYVLTRILKHNFTTALEFISDWATILAFNQSFISLIQVQCHSSHTDLLLCDLSFETTKRSLHWRF